jgi:glycosyltransferase involved in cell wall biosynthesis
VPSGDVVAYAEAIITLLDRGDQRARMGQEGRARIANELGWPHQRDAYVFVYDRLVGRTATDVTRTGSQARG